MLGEGSKYLIDHIDKNLDLDFISTLNYHVARNHSLNWGVLRTGSIGISGIDYRPNIPIEEEVTQKISDILSSDQSVTGKALKLFLWGCRSQLFWDGNKRTSFLSANKLLISEGKGLLVIEDKDLREFNHELSYYYETNDDEAIMKFLYTKCIQGINKP